MNITLLCSDEQHPINPYLERWMIDARDRHQVEIVRSKAEARGGDFLFLISCAEIIRAEDRGRYGHTLVLHASDLPRGRGWSPHIWELTQGAASITVSLLEAEDKVDTGRIWKKQTVPIAEHALWDEINEALFSAELALIRYAVEHHREVEPTTQDPTVEASYYARRTPDMSRIDPHRSLDEQFDLLRVCDPNRFPAFFELRGQRYELTLKKSDDH